MLISSLLTHNRPITSHLHLSFLKYFIMEQKEINALIGLLDDPDENIYSHVKDKLLDIGHDIIPLLEKAWETKSFGILFESRIENIIHSLQFDAVQKALTNWNTKGGYDLLEALLIVARYQYPDLDENKITETIEQLKKDIWIELNDQLTALEKIKVMNHVFFDVHGFAGNISNYHSPQNSYINCVLESKKGNPISLGLLYILTAKQLDLPIFGVNLPRHFILCFIDNLADESKKEDNILFYINPFSKGTVLSKREVEHFLKQLKIESQNSFFQPCTNKTIIQRVLNNLLYSYQKLGHEEKVEEIQQLLNIVSPIQKP